MLDIYLHVKGLFSKCACVLMVTSDWIFRDAHPGSKVSGVEVVSWFAVWRSCQGYLDHSSISRSSASCFGSVNTWPLAVMISPLTRPLVSLLCRATVSTFRLVNADLDKQTWQPWLGTQQGSGTGWENQVESTWRINRVCVCVCVRVKPVAAISQSDQKFFGVGTQTHILDWGVSNCSLSHSHRSREAKTREDTEPHRCVYPGIRNVENTQS